MNVHGCTVLFWCRDYITLGPDRIPMVTSPGCQWQAPALPPALKPLRTSNRNNTLRRCHPQPLRLAGGYILSVRPKNCWGYLGLRAYLASFTPANLDGRCPVSTGKFPVSPEILHHPCRNQLVHGFHGGIFPPGHLVGRQGLSPEPLRSVLHPATSLGGGLRWLQVLHRWGRADLRKMGLTLICAT